MVRSSIARGGDKVSAAAINVVARTSMRAGTAGGVAEETRRWRARGSLSTLTCSCVWGSAVVVRTGADSRASAVRRGAKETRRWCASCSTTNALSAVGCRAVGLRAEKTDEAEAREVGMALGRRRDDIAEVEWAVGSVRLRPLGASRWIGRLPSYYRTLGAETHFHCRLLAQSLGTNFNPSTHRRTKLAIDGRGKYGRC